MKLPETISNVYAGTIGGTLLSVFGSIGALDMLKTAILAAIGAAVSFGVSAGLRWICGRKNK